MGQLKYWIGFLLILLGIFIFLAFKPKPGRKDLPENEISLGKKLFFDPILSKNNSVSCASCHKPQHFFADTVDLSIGIFNQKAARNTPSAMNMAARSTFFWDGRAQTLEEQALGPITNPLEMGMTLELLESKLNKSDFYVQAFQKIYKQKPNRQNIAKALAAFEKTLETAGSPFDAYMRGDTTAISASARRGHELFVGKGRCFDCHFSPDFTGDEFKNIGTFNGRDWNDSGRFKFTRNVEDIGKFKVPGLRNVAKTFPYMHNGKMKTLEEVVSFYAEPERFVSGAKYKDSVAVAIPKLTKQEQKDLVEFLESLTSK